MESEPAAGRNCRGKEAPLAATCAGLDEPVPAHRLPLGMVCRGTIAAWGIYATSCAADATSGLGERSLRCILAIADLG